MPLPALIATPPSAETAALLRSLPSGLEAEHATDWPSALEAVRRRDWGALLLDPVLAGEDPGAAVESLLAIRDGLTVILLTEEPGRLAEEPPPRVIRLARACAPPAVLSELLRLAGMERRSRRACASLAEENARLRRRVAALGPSGPGSGGFPPPASPPQAEELRLLAEMKTQLLYHIAHELRSPLVSVRGYTEMFYRGVYGAIPENQRGYLERSLENVDRLTQLAQSLVRYVTFAREHPPLRLERTPLLPLVTEVARGLAGEAAAAGVGLEVTPLDAPAVAVVDRAALRTVLERLFRNAIRFSRAPGRVRVLFDRVDENLLKLRVQDNGPGVTPQDLLRIFAEPPVHTLSRMRDLLRLHGSELRVTNMPEGGASFYFTLALVEPEGAATAGAGEPRRSG